MLLRRFAIGFALALSPAVAMADETMPQMDFHNPLTTDQVGWMAVIMVVLYFALSRWGLPEIGKVLDERAARIFSDLETARAAKAEADIAVKALNATMKQAREKAQADIGQAVADAKAKALADAKALAEKLDAQLAYSEKVIADARAEALASIKPVAADAAAAILARLTGKAPEGAVLGPEVDAALAARKAA